jgi:hypothetical protein
MEFFESLIFFFKKYILKVKGGRYAPILKIYILTLLQAKYHIRTFPAH